MLNGNKEYGAFDRFKIIAALLVIAVHTGPLLMINSAANTILNGIIARVAVPFFMMVTGFFVLNPNSFNIAKLKKYIVRLLIYYCLASIIYIPINIYANGINIDLMSFIKALLFDGSFYHLWYFPSTIIGLYISFKLINKFSLKKAFIISIVLYVIGLLGDCYYGLIEGIDSLNMIYSILFNISSYTRNGLFYAPIFIVMGASMNGKDILDKKENLIYFIVFLLFMIFEGVLLNYVSWIRHDSMYLFLIPLMYFLFTYLKQVRLKNKPMLRNIATIVYIIHPLIIVVIRGISKPLKLNYLLVDNTFILFILCTLISFTFAYVVALFTKSKDNDTLKGRAWIEISRKALRHNIKTISEMMEDETELMPVLKANAYGHGLTLVAKEYNKMGIRSFCVATLDEAIELRKAHIKGDILILGYTNDQYVNELKKYKLTQTIVDIDHASKLNLHNKKVKVHLALDTGMNRIGINPQDIDGIKRVINMKGLVVTGVFSHLSCSDSKSIDDISYTYKQIDIFNACIKQLEISDMKIHIQASSGLINYPIKAMSYARVGLALFGPYVQPINGNIKLIPVLSLKARIATIKYLNAGDNVGYKRAFTATSQMKIATITIGYGDGLARSLSNKKGYVLYKNHQCPIIGRICMDQCMVDVTNVAGIQPFDEVTIIGSSSSHIISINDMAKLSNTIPNEVLTKLQTRLPRIIVD